MKKSASAVSVIGGADGPTSIFFKKNAKLTLKQKIQRAKNKIKRFYVDKTLSCESHSLDEVIEYIVNRYGFAEVDKDAEEFPEEYQQMRASFIIQYAPELLGESTACPKLKSESPKDVEAYIRQSEERMQRAMEIPSTEFDIDFHKFKKASQRNLFKTPLQDSNLLHRVNNFFIKLFYIAQTFCFRYTLKICF